VCISIYLEKGAGERLMMVKCRVKGFGRQEVSERVWLGAGIRDRKF
jgi:hypothetical protein